MKPTCPNCKFLKTQTLGGDPIGHSCVGDPRGGKKWAPSVAQKDGRCGPKRVWFELKGTK